MPQSRTIIQIFVSSPSDVQQEREALETIVAELNRTWSNSLNLIFELIKWETHTYPAFSIDPQSAINDQIGDSYDVFLGIIWGRFGTPTPRAESGTHEEFLRALDRHKREGAPEIMIYFKDKPIAPSRIDLEQIQKVIEFRKSLSSLGGLYSTFDDMPGFESSLRSHLSVLAQYFSNQKDSPTSPQKTLIASPSNGDELDDLGFLDYLEIYEARMTEMNSTLNIMSDATVRVGEQISLRAAEINALNKNTPDMISARRIIKRSAENMTSYADTLAQHLPLFSTARSAALQALSNSLVMRSEFPDTDPSQLVSAYGALKTMLESLRGAKDGLLGLRNNINSLPRLTSEINKAKRAAVTQLNSLIEDLDKTDATVSNIIDSISKMQN